MFWLMMYNWSHLCSSNVSRLALLSHTYSLTETLQIQAQTEIQILIQTLTLTLTENDLAKDWPEVTTVRTTGELLDKPMSMYTAKKCIVSAQNCWIYHNHLVVFSERRNSLCAPVLVPQMAGTGEPPLTLGKQNNSHFSHKFSFLWDNTGTHSLKGQWFTLSKKSCSLWETDPDSPINCLSLHLFVCLFIHLCIYFLVCLFLRETFWPNDELVFATFVCFNFLCLLVGLFDREMHADSPINWSSLHLLSVLSGWARVKNIALFERPILTHRWSVRRYICLFVWSSLYLLSICVFVFSLFIGLFVFWLRDNTYQWTDRRYIYCPCSLAEQGSCLRSPVSAEMGLNWCVKEIKELHQMKSCS